MAIIYKKSAPPVATTAAPVLPLELLGEALESLRLNKYPHLQLYLIPPKGIHPLKCVRVTTHVDPEVLPTPHRLEALTLEQLPVSIPLDSLLESSYHPYWDPK